MYLASLRRAAASAAEPAKDDVVAMYERAVVSVTVTSHVAHRPSRQGIRVKPSGRLPSDLVRPCGSLTAAIPALDMARQTKSLM